MLIIDQVATAPCTDDSIEVRFPSFEEEPPMANSHADHLRGMVLIVCALFLFVSIVSAQSIEPKRIVVLYWDNKDFPGNARFEENFKTRLQLGQRQDVEYF